MKLASPPVCSEDVNVNPPHLCKSREHHISAVDGEILGRAVRPTGCGTMAVQSFTVASIRYTTAAPTLFIGVNFSLETARPTRLPATLGLNVKTRSPLLVEVAEPPIEKDSDVILCPSLIPIARELT
jgi:hypothetical protein